MDIKIPFQGRIVTKWLHDCEGGGCDSQCVENNYFCHFSRLLHIYARTIDMYEFMVNC